jgi:hypothetical protein
VAQPPSIAIRTQRNIHFMDPPNAPVERAGISQAAKELYS